MSDALAASSSPTELMRASLHKQDRERARCEIFAALCRINSGAAALLRSSTRLGPGGKARLEREIEQLDKLIGRASIDDCRPCIEAHVIKFESLQATSATNDSSRVLVALGFEILPLLEKLKTLLHICEAYPLSAQRRASELLPTGLLK